MPWLLKHWPILALIFASGSAAAWQEIQRQTIADVVIEQHEQAKEQRRYGEALIRLQGSQKGFDRRQVGIEKKLDLLIEMQLKRVER